MSLYQEILAVSEPNNIGTDENKRALLAVEYDCVADAPIESLEREIAKILTVAGIATAIGTDIFLSRSAVIPTGDGPYIEIWSTGGTRPTTTHNNNVMENKSFQVTVRGLDYEVALVKALAVWRELHGSRDRTVTL